MLIFKLLEKGAENHNTLSTPVEVFSVIAKSSLLLSGNIGTWHFVYYTKLVILFWKI